MTTETPLPLPAWLLIAALLLVLVIIYNNAGYADGTTAVTIPASTPTRARTATPATRNPATATDSPTPLPGGRSLPPDEMLEFPPELETRVEIEPTIPTPTLSRPTQPTPMSDTTRPPALVGKALVVDQDAQVLRVYEDGVEVRVLPVSTGVPPLYTPAFLGHIGRYAGTIYGYGELADNAWYVLTARGNIYIHSAPYTLSEGVKVYKEIESLGVRPSSHGCIRLHPADAEWLTAWNPQGVPILITPLDLSKEW